MYAANVIIAGFVGLVCLMGSRQRVHRVFGNHFWGAGTKVVGAFWLSLALVSVLGFQYPLVFAPVLVIQFIYKTIWLLFEGIPKALDRQTGNLPRGMFVIILIWALVLPFVIPWGGLLYS